MTTKTEKIIIYEEEMNEFLQAMKRLGIKIVKIETVEDVNVVTIEE